MQFIRVEGGEAVTSALAQRLNSELSAGRVLWLVSGGSNIEISVAVMKQISEELSGQLSVMPVDERYGPVGHADSNWARLMASGFATQSATLLPALKDGLDFAANSAYYNQLAQQAFASNDVVIGQLGIGTDGHIAGILPGSPVTQATDLVVRYEAAPYQRLTLTFPALRQISVAYAAAFGAAKLEALSRLRSEDLPLEEQPAQVLKSLPEAYVYSDQLGEA